MPALCVPIAIPPPQFHRTKSILQRCTQMAHVITFLTSMRMDVSI